MEAKKSVSNSQRHVQGALAHLFSMGGVRFVLGGEMVQGELVFSETGFMPHIASLADEVMSGLGWPTCVRETTEEENSLLGVKVALIDPLPVLAVSALLTAAETMFLSEPVSLRNDLRMTEVTLDPVFDYWRSTQLKSTDARDCPWRNRIPIL
ncbi:MAG: hypothetical protein VB138_01995 [Burkholderia sp.]